MTARKALLSIAITMIMAYSFSNNRIVVVAYNNHHNLPSRRHVLQSIWKVGAVTALSHPTRSHAAESAPDDQKAAEEAEREKQDAEREKRKAEKEARRLAEETKKRLAVGRIGTI